MWPRTNPRAPIRPRPWPSAITLPSARTECTLCDSSTAALGSGARRTRTRDSDERPTRGRVVAGCVPRVLNALTPPIVHRGTCTSNETSTHTAHKKQRPRGAGDGPWKKDTPPTRERARTAGHCNDERARRRSRRTKARNMTRDTVSHLKRNTHTLAAHWRAPPDTNTEGETHARGTHGDVCAADDVLKRVAGRRPETPV